MQSKLLIIHYFTKTFLLLLTLLALILFYLNLNLNSEENVPSFFRKDTRHC